MIKYSYILLLPFLLACEVIPNDRESQQNALPALSKEAFPLKVLEPEELHCLDTQELNRHAIDYQLVDGQDSFHIKLGLKKWSLRLNVVLSADHVTSVDQYYSATVQDGCKEKITYFPIDSLVIHYADGSSETKIFDPERNHAHLQLSPFQADKCRLADLNSDGFADLELYLNEASGATNALSNVYLYRPKKNTFSKAVSLSNFAIDKTKGLIYHSWNGGAAGDISTRIWSDFDENDELRPRRIEERDIIEGQRGKVVVVTRVFDELGRENVNVDTVDAHH